MKVVKSFSSSGSGRGSHKINLSSRSFFLPLLAVNVSTFKTIIQGFELNYNNRSKNVLNEKSKLDEIKAQIKNLDENQDTTDLDEKIKELDIQIEKSRDERLKINTSKESEILQVQNQL